MKATFAGGGNHWRVLPLPCNPGGAWQVYRRKWDHWEPIGSPYLSQLVALTEAHRLARLSRA